MSRQPRLSVARLDRTQWKKRSAIPVAPQFLDDTAQVALRLWRVGANRPLVLLQHFVQRRVAETRVRAFQVALELCQFPAGKLVISRAKFFAVQLVSEPNPGKVFAGWFVTVKARSFRFRPNIVFDHVR